MDKDEVQSFMTRAGEAGEKAFDILGDFQDAITVESGNKYLAESLTIDASIDILTSLVANVVNSGTGNSDEKGEKVAKDLRKRIRDLVRNFFLESGAKIISFELEEEGP